MMKIGPTPNLKGNSTATETSSAALQAGAKSGLKSLKNRQDLGFLQLPFREELLQSTVQLADQLKSKYDRMVFVGIGGSSLGPRVIEDCFAHLSQKKISFLDNLDPLEYRKTAEVIRSSFSKCCFVFVSKSGNTLETLSTLDFLIQDLGAAVIQQSVVITEPRSNPLYDWAQKHNCPKLEIPIDVGGRFSVLSPVGMLVAAFLNASPQLMLKGAAQALQDEDLVSDLMARSLESFEKELWITQFWFYSSSLRNFGGWLQQLWAESLAKKITRQGGIAPRVSTPIFQVGACDQHSVLQQCMEGHQDKWIIFNRVRSLEAMSESLRKSSFPHLQFTDGKKMGEILGAEAQATQAALAQQGVSTLQLWWEDCKPESLGYMFMFWQLVVGGLGESLSINAFDQPGVELGKKLTKEALKTL